MKPGQFSMNEDKVGVFIRADANPNIGMGHIIRCLSIADSFSAKGHMVTFVLADDKMDDFVKQHGYKTVILHSVYTRMDEELWPEMDTEIIIVDSYYVTASYLWNLRKKAGLLVYMDDMNAFSYPVDVVVNYNAYGPYLDYESAYIGTDRPLFILGPAYAPLRRMFRGIEKKIQRKVAEDVLISTGGSDPEHISLKFIMTGPTGFRYHILLGNMNQDREEIERWAQGNPGIVLHENVTDMKNLISRMDIAVSAAGSTLYEICACGVPLITFSFADNQIPGAKAFEKLGLAICVGDMREEADPSRRILSAVEKLGNDYERRTNIGIRMQELVDGLGADRLVNKIVTAAQMRD